MSTDNSIIQASGLYLTRCLPDDWANLPSVELRELCASTVLQLYEAYTGRELFTMIQAAALWLTGIQAAKDLALYELRAANAELHKSISGIHVGYARQLNSKQELWESALASYHEVSAREDGKVIAEQAAYIDKLEELQAATIEQVRNLSIVVEAGL